MPSISIITPAYIDTNERLEWFNEAVKSVQAQTFTDWEMIVVDDASPIRPAVEQPDDRLRFFRLVNRGGPALARNTAAALALAEALLPLDADDLLASPDVLARLYDAWQADRKIIIYGDLQRLERGGGGYQAGRKFDLPEYDFAKALDLNGIMPVTALHSIDCHRAAGGWKPELEAGLEDVEYWIAAGKAGFCGRRVPGVTLFYRKHESSRATQLRHVNRREVEMRNLIRSMHQDVYSGRYPMGCCGGGKSYTPPVSNTSSSASVAMATTLDKYGANEKVWVEYSGRRQGTFGIVGQYTGINYSIHGPGHKFEVHVNDLPKFRRSGRGSDFKIGAVAPAEVQPAVEIVEIAAPFVATAPVVAQVERLDKKALGR